MDDLRRLRSHRNPRDRDLTIGALVRQAETDLKKKARSLGGMAGAWEAVIPPTLAGRCRLQTFSRGVLTVRAADASARFELDRFLRSGGEAALSRRGGAALKRIKIVI